MKALFVTWDSPETSYLEGLFFPLFAAIRAHGVTVEVLQFTWGDAVDRRKEAAAAMGVTEYRLQALCREGVERLRKILK